MMSKLKITYIAEFTSDECTAIMLKSSGLEKGDFLRELISTGLADNRGIASWEKLEKTEAELAPEPPHEKKARKPKPMTHL
jgi:hypothetical protein